MAYNIPHRKMQIIAASRNGSEMYVDSIGPNKRSQLVEFQTLENLAWPLLSAEFPSESPTVINNQ